MYGVLHMKFVGRMIYLYSPEIPISTETMLYIYQRQQSNLKGYMYILKVPRANEIKAKYNHWHDFSHLLHTSSSK